MSVRRFMVFLVLFVLISFVVGVLFAFGETNQFWLPDFFGDSALPQIETFKLEDSHSITFGSLGEAAGVMVGPIAVTDISKEDSTVHFKGVLRIGDRNVTLSWEARGLIDIYKDVHRGILPVEELSKYVNEGDIVTLRIHYFEPNSGVTISRVQQYVREQTRDAFDYPYVDLLPLYYNGFGSKLVSREEVYQIFRATSAVVLDRERFLIWGVEIH